MPPFVSISFRVVFKKKSRVIERQHNFSCASGCVSPWLQTYASIRHRLRISNKSNSQACADRIGVSTQIPSPNTATSQSCPQQYNRSTTTYVHFSVQRSTPLDRFRFSTKRHFRIARRSHSRFLSRGTLVASALLHTQLYPERVAQPRKLDWICAAMASQATKI